MSQAARFFDIQPSFAQKSVVVHDIFAQRQEMPAPAQITLSFARRKDDRIVPSRGVGSGRLVRLLQGWKKDETSRSGFSYRGSALVRLFFFAAAGSARGVGFACVLNGAHCSSERAHAAIRSLSIARTPID